MIGATVLFAVDYKKASEAIVQVKRNVYGEGNRTEQLKILVDGEKQEKELDVFVGELQYSSEELEEVFERSIKKLEQSILGKNESLDEVRKNLNLITEVPGEPMLVEWEIDRYDLINIYGEINQEVLEKESEGVLAELKAYIRYIPDETKEILHVFHVRICPEKQTLADKIYKELLTIIEEKEAQSVTERYVDLPNEYEGKALTFQRPMDYRSLIFLGLGLIFSSMLCLLEKQNQKEDAKRKEEQMMKDYPEIIGKLNLLLGAGMTVKNAWKKIVEDYERQKKIQGIRFAYEEMRKVYHEMQSGVVEKECYEHFGRNCRLRPYRKLGVLLSQNSRKGTKGLTELLNTESVSAYEERKMRAKRMGEEAGTKLLLPMFLMLSVVLIIVIVPAFISIRL